MRPCATRVRQTIVVSFLCLWFLVFVRNLSVLITEYVDNFSSFQQQLFANEDEEFRDPSTSLLGLELEKEYLQTIYENENNTRNIANSKRVTPDENIRQHIRDVRNKRNQLSGIIDRFGNKEKTFLGHRHYENINDNDDDDYNYNYDSSRRFETLRKQSRRTYRRRKGRYHGATNASPILKIPTLLLPTPIIVMGFPKGGTSSIFSFFQQQGLRSQHWYCCKKQHHPAQGGPRLMAGCLLNNLKKGNETNIFNGCGNLDVFSEINGPRKARNHPTIRNKKGYLLDDGSFDFDGPGERLFFPQRFRIQELHDSYPNATWILNWRDFDPWIDSVMKWGSVELHYQFLNEFYMQGAIPSIPPSSNLTLVKEVMKKIYLEHFDLVRDFVREHPSHALVEVNITDKNASMVLAEAFGLNTTAWKHVNKSIKKSYFGSLTATKRRMFTGFKFRGTSTWWMFVLATLLYFSWTLGIEWGKRDNLLFLFRAVHRSLRTGIL